MIGFYAKFSKEEELMTTFVYLDRFSRQPRVVLADVLAILDIMAVE